jgi:hypothetical protein
MIAPGPMVAPSVFMFRMLAHLHFVRRAPHTIFV